MSLEALSWAIKLEGLKPYEKLTLIALANCHNPVNGCFPSQAYLAQTTGISRRSINDQLERLEAEGHIIRSKQTDEDTGRRKSTRYFLACEDDFPCARDAHGPCANDDTFHVHHVHTETVRGNSKENPNGFSQARARESGPDPAVAEAFTLFLEKAQRNGWPIPRELSRDRVRKLQLRLKDIGPHGWREALDKAEASQKIRELGFFTFDWVMKPANLRKLLEGNYDGSTRAGAAGRQQERDRVTAELHDIAVEFDRRQAASRGAGGRMPG